MSEPRSKRTGRTGKEAAEALRQPPEYETFACEEVGEAWQALRKQVQRGEPLTWTGPDRLHHSIAAGSPPPSQYLTPEGREYDEERGRDIWDTLFLIAFQVGFHNGTVQEARGGTDYYKRMVDRDQTLIERLGQQVEDAWESRSKAREQAHDAVSALRALDDALCNALSAAQEGSYDQLTVAEHLEALIERVRGIEEVTREEDDPPATRDA